MTNINLAAAVFAVAALFTGAQAQAHAKLVSATPAQDSTVGAPTELVLKFSETLAPKFSSLAITSMGNTAVASKVSIAKDGVTMTAKPAKPLGPGAYTVSWHAVTADTHRMEGKYNFTVR